ncbi:M14 family zinc carboxypeptidase [Salinibius halmophilus]|uniref:M14 family zinc carboxypeptidase n=1 Tax=Salinibius halmophilus TaxID=1853216 RepID=UPI000E675749|nr:M14 family zinc carboxypeptidase [Salinibius halmophilus]
MKRALIAAIAALAWSPLLAQPASPEVVSEFCQQVDDRLASVDYKMCTDLQLDTLLGESVEGRPILGRQFEASKDDAIKVLFLGGIHGDELSSVSITYIWMDTLRQYHSGNFDWWVVPVVNPDGLLRQENGRYQSSRWNANEVDLNRNFLPSNDDYLASEYRDQQKAQRPRYYPGPEAVSEPESKLVDRMILGYRPDIIFSVHAPHGIIDFDGSTAPPPPRSFGSLSHRALGTFPGSLGDFAWNRMGIPVVTIELASAGSMPTQSDIDQMWRDIVRYLYQFDRNRNQ